jgi:hypothetical protein
VSVRIQMRRGTTSEWNSANPILNEGEIGYNSTLSSFKIGDGTSVWSSLPYFAAGGDITGITTAGGSGLLGGASSGNVTLSIDTTVTADLATAQTLTNKTLTTPIISSISNTGTLTLPTSTDTLVGRATTDTLTNKTLTSPKINEDVAVTATATELNYVDGVTSAIQTQLDAKSTASKTETLTNKSISLATNTLTGTLAEFNTALADADFATIAGTETLTNKTLTSPSVGASLTTASTSFDLLNTTATTVNFAGAASNISIGSATSTTTVNDDLVVTGDLTVNGTTTTINSQTLSIEDKNIILADANTSDVGADGGGITLKGATDKTFNWVDATDSWTSSEDMNLLTGKVYKINGTSVLSGSTLGSGVTGSSLTSVGTITSGTWNGTAIAVANGGTGSTTTSDARTALGLAIGTDVQAYNSTLAAVAGGTYTGDDSITTLGTISAGIWNGTTIAIANGGTGATTAMTAATALLPSQTGNSGKYLTNDGSGTLSWGTVSGYSAPTIGSTSIASGATVTTIAGLTLTAPTLTGTVTASGDINLSATGGPGSLIDELTLLLIGAL